MFDDFKPFVVVFEVIGGTEEIVKLLVGEVVLKDLSCDFVKGCVGKFEPAGVGEEFV